MKYSDIIKSAGSNLMRNKGRTILTIIAIFVGAFTISLTTGVNTGVNDYIDKQIGSVGASNLLYISPKSESSVPNSNEPTKYDPDKKTSSVMQATAMTDEDITKVEKIKGIESVEPFKSVSINYVQGENDEKYVFSAMAISNGVTIDLDSGEKVSQKTEDYEIDLAPEYVKSLGFKSNDKAIGQTVKLGVSSSATGEETIIEAKIVGVRNTSLIQGGMSLLNKALVDKIVEINENGLPESMQNQYGMLEATIAEDSTKENISDIKDRLDKAGYTGVTVEDEIGMIRSVINTITNVLTMFGAIALLAASFGIINTLYMSVQERTREIGLMKAMGLSNGKVFVIFSVEAALIGLLGSILGILGSMGIGALINQAASDSFLKDLTGFTLLQFSVNSSIIITLIIMLIAFLAGTLPASRAAKLDPIESLRYE